MTLLVQTDQIATMNNIESPSTNTAVNTHTEQPVSIPEAEGEHASTSFYVVGGVINITMITAYFIWAYRAWKKADKRGGR